MNRKNFFEIATKCLLYFNALFILGYTFFVFMDSIWSKAAANLFTYKLLKYFILSFVITCAMIIYYLITKNPAKIIITNIIVLLLLCLAEFVIYTSKLYPMHFITYGYYILSMLICIGKVLSKNIVN